MPQPTLFWLGGDFDFGPIQAKGQDVREAIVAQPTQTPAQAKAASVGHAYPCDGKLGHPPKMAIVRLVQPSEPGMMSQHGHENDQRTADFCRQARRKGLDVRELSLPPANGKVFSLDIPSPRTWLTTPFESTNRFCQVLGTSDRAFGTVNCFYRTRPVMASCCDL